MISDDKWSHLHIVVATSGNILLNNLDLAIDRQGSATSLRGYGGVETETS